MKRSPHLDRRRVGRLLSVALTAAAIGLWLAFAPVPLGGSATYVTTYGTSMEPMLHRGDLAIVRPQPSYKVGDVVAYRSSSLRTVVLHRIIGHEGDRFVFKGDNNTWTDSDRPTASDLVGKMDLRLAGLGDKLQRVASPPGIASLAGMAAFPVGTTRRRRRGERRPSAATPSAATPGRHRISWGPVDQRLVMATAIGAILTAIAFSKPLTASGTNDVAFEERGTFSYSAAAPEALAAYPSGEVETGQPVFLNLVQDLRVDFRYRTSSTQPVVTQGELRLAAEVRDANGWSRSFELAGPVPVTADGGRASGTLKLAAVRSALVDMEAASGVHRNAYMLSLRATTTRHASHGTATADGIFVAALDFELTDLELHLAGGERGGDAVSPSQGSLLSVPVEHQNHLEILGREVPIAALRAAAVALLVLLGAAWLDWFVRAGRGAEASRIAARYRSYLLPVRALAPAVDSIHVTSMGDLAKLADRAGAPVLHDAGGVYQVHDGDQVYRYTCEGAGS